MNRTNCYYGPFRRTASGKKLSMRDSSSRTGYVVTYRCKHFSSLIWLSASPFSIRPPWNIFHCQLRTTIVVSIHKELCKHSKVQTESSSTSDEPAKIDQDVLSVNRQGLAFLAIAFVPVSMTMATAHRLEGKNAENVGEIANAGEEEEECLRDD